jgi:hypothetical protein
MGLNLTSFPINSVLLDQPLDELPPFLYFLSKRWKNGHLIETLDITYHVYTQKPRGMGVFKAKPRLTIVWSYVY